MIHKNRGNRRWTDKRKRKHKYNLAKRICNKIKGVLGKYDKGHIYDLNDKLAPSEHEHDYYQDGISHSDKKKLDSCNYKIMDYENEPTPCDIRQITSDCFEQTYIVDGEKVTKNVPVIHGVLDVQTGTYYSE